jgi:hypothetical protein
MKRLARKHPRVKAIYNYTGMGEVGIEEMGEMKSPRTPEGGKERKGVDC